MGSRGLNDVAEYIRTLKRVTIFTQLLPFLYSLCYIAVLLVYQFVPEWAVDLLDSLFYISPAFMAGAVILSRLLHLCRWHQLACVIPAISQIPVLFDRFFSSMDQGAAMISNISVALMAALFIISAYKVFLR